MWIMTRCLVYELRWNKFFRSSSEHRSSCSFERRRFTKKRPHPNLKISRIIAAQSWKRNAFAAAVVRLPLTTETQILSRSTHTSLRTHTRTSSRNPATHTYQSSHVRIIGALTFEFRVAFWSFFFCRRTLFVRIYKEVSPCDYGRITFIKRWHKSLKEFEYLIEKL